LEETRDALRGEIVSADEGNRSGVSGACVRYLNMTIFFKHDSYEMAKLYNKITILALTKVNKC